MYKDKNWKKVVVERPRGGGTRREGSKQDRAKDRHLLQTGTWDDLPKMERLYSEGRMNDRDSCSKRFNDYLNPLERWLRKQVGRRWNDVFSELRGMVDNRGTLGRHVYQHLDGWVAKNVVIYDDGEVWSFDGHPTKLGSWSWRRSPDLYVHPDTGLLTAMPDLRAGRKAARRERDAAFLREKSFQKDGHHYVKDQGIWYEVVYSTVTDYVIDYVSVKVDGEWKRQRVGGHHVSRTVVSGKRQLSTKDLRTLNLVNQPVRAA